MQKIATAMLLMLVKAWAIVDILGSDFKVNVDKKRYKDLVMECFGKIKSSSLRNRLKALSKNFKAEVFLNHRHKERFYNALQNNRSDINNINPRHIAILLLLTADERFTNKLVDKNINIGELNYLMKKFSYYHKINNESYLRKYV